MPHLFVWGDYVNRHAVCQRIVAAPNRYRDAVRAGGGRVDTLDLPSEGARNSRMLMMDRNSDGIGPPHRGLESPA